MDLNIEVEPLEGASGDQKITVTSGDARFVCMPQIDRGEKGADPAYLFYKYHDREVDHQPPAHQVLGSIGDLFRNSGLSLFCDPRKRSGYLSAMGINSENLAFFTAAPKEGIEYKFSYKLNAGLTAMHDDLCMLIHKVETGCRLLEPGVAFELYRNESIDVPVMYSKGAMTFQPFQNGTRLAFAIRDFSGQASLMWMARDLKDPLFSESIQAVYKAMILQKPDLHNMRSGAKWFIGRTGTTVDVVLEALETSNLVKPGMTQEYLECIERTGGEPSLPKLNSKPLIRRMDMG